jgi:hypothetical protein
MIVLLALAAIGGAILIPDPMWANISLFAALLFSYAGIRLYGN